MGCKGSCSNCGDKCDKQPLKETLHEGASVKKLVGIVSGKGGVGKSLVTSLLASRVCKDGFKSAVLDADITGPSIPLSFGLGSEKAESFPETNADGSEGGYLKPVKSKSGIQLMSMNFLLQNETDPVVWRGPVISGAVRQFWTDVLWEDVDFMFVDCPPGTGDVPLTVFQSLPIDGIIIVASPQELVRVIVEKAVNMAQMMSIPVLGLIENMSYVKCPDCGKEIKVFGKSNIENIASDFNLKILAQIPIKEEIATAVDKGEVEEIEDDFIIDAAKTIENLI